MGGLHVPRKPFHPSGILRFLAAFFWYPYAIPASLHLSIVTLQQGHLYLLSSISTQNKPHIGHLGVIEVIPSAFFLLTIVTLLVNNCRSERVLTKVKPPKLVGKSHEHLVGASSRLILSTY